MPGRTDRDCIWFNRVAFEQARGHIWTGQRLHFNRPGAVFEQGWISEEFMISRTKHMMSYAHNSIHDIINMASYTTSCLYDISLQAIFHIKCVYDMTIRHHTLYHIPDICLWNHIWYSICMISYVISSYFSYEMYVWYHSNISCTMSYTRHMIS